jgi:hypothetical protein
MQAEIGLPSQVILKVSDECQTDLLNEPERISMVEQSAQTEEEDDEKQKYMN